MSSEKPAKGVTGHLLYSPVTDTYFFRVYDKQDRSKFLDYRISAEGIEITIEDSHISLIDKPQMGDMTWSSRVLGKAKRTNAELLKLAKENPPSPDWFEGEQDKPF